MATFTYTPDNGASYTIKPNVRVSKFGDGYEQRAGNGINLNPKVWTLKFSMRVDAEALAITSFLEAQAGLTSFTWTDINGSTNKYVCRTWTVVKDHYNLNTVSASFEQVFEP